MTQKTEHVEMSSLQGRGRLGPLVFFVGMGIVLALNAGAHLLSFSPQWIGGIVILSVIILILAGLPVGISMIGASIVGLWAIGGWNIVASTLERLLYDSSSSWSYTVIPMFILMGTVLWKSGLTNSAFNTARQWFGKLPGGLAVATNFAGAGLAAASGSTIGITYALGRISIPEMLKSGYRPSLAVGTVAAAGTLGQIIPPSLLLVIYAGVAQLPIGPQLLAGVVPGILLAVGFAVMILARASLQKELAPAVAIPGVTWGTRLRSVIDLLPLAIVIAVVIGGLFLGVFTATESAAFGALIALVFGAINRFRESNSLRPVWMMLRDSLAVTVTGVAAIFLLIAGVQVMTRVMALSRLANDIAVAIVDLGLNRVTLLLLLVVLFIILGMFMDTLAMMLLTIPVLLGPVQAIGVDPIWFGVFIVIMAEIGLMTPPLGILSFIVHRIAADPDVNLGKPISLIEVFKGVLWFSGVALVVIVFIIFVPDIVTWLPNQMFSR